MKQILLTFLTCLAFVSCSAFDDDYFTDHSGESAKRIVDKFQVSLKSASYFAHAVSFDDSISRRVASIEAMAHGRDTLLYIVNFANKQGWLVLSGDKRTEAVLASAQTGYFEKKNLGGAAAWMNDLASKIYAIKQANLQDTSSTSYFAWCKIDTLAMGLQKSFDDPSTNSTSSSTKTSVIPKTKAIGGNDETDDGRTYYYYDENDYAPFLIKTEILLETNKKVGPLIKTQWGQSKPWNDCTPKWQYTNDRCLTGCVAVAGAQMLYYFHYLKNKPAAFFSQGRCDGFVYPSQAIFSTKEFHFSSPQEDVWDEMALSSAATDSTKQTHLVAILMGYVGNQLGMNYTYWSSSTQTAKLVDLYRSFGIDSKLEIYEPSLVQRSLDHQLPVNVRANSGKVEDAFLLFSTKDGSGTGHSWIIDGYKEKITRYRFTYQWQEKLQKRTEPERLPDFPEDVDKPKKPRHTTPPPSGTFIEDRTDRTLFWTMNFGWGKAESNQGEFSSETNAVWKQGGSEFQADKYIIHEFKF